jgi:hypothetical protein
MRAAKQPDVSYMMKSIVLAAAIQAWPASVRRVLPSLYLPIRLLPAVALFFVQVAADEEVWLSSVCLHVFQTF